MRSRAAVAAIIDVALVAVFVVLGRRSHAEGETLRGIAGVATPFLLGLAVGWVGGRAWRAPFAMRTAVTLWASTVAVGLLLRRVAFDRGVAIAFVIVATVVLGAFLLGWRAIAARVVDRDGGMPVGAPEREVQA